MIDATRESDNGEGTREERWKDLLCRERFIPFHHDSRASVDIHEPYRRTYQKDYDRIIFSSAFRRLQGKTQVHPFPKFDYTRVRLTHSLEVASVARTLGRAAGAIILMKDRGVLELYKEFSSSPQHMYFLKEHDDHPLAFVEDIATLVSAAALAHDIGNPPFGHSGEYSIREWFDNFFQKNKDIIDDKYKTDFLMYEGNALGFRTLTKLQGWRNRGGLQVSLSVLAASIKYPQTSDMIKKRKSNKSYYKKFHVFHDDKKNFSHVVEKCGLRRKNGLGDDFVFQRHPFAYLVEAADDICYLVTDVEDAAKAGIIRTSTAIDILRGIFKDSFSYGTNRLDLLDNDEDRLGYMRSGAIGAMIDVAIESFERHYDAIVDGNFVGDLFAQSRISGQMKEIRDLCENQLYFGREKLLAETGGATVISSLLDQLVPAALEFTAKERDVGQMSPMNARRFSLIPKSFTNNIADEYTALLSVTDYIGGMTDKYASDLHRGFKGGGF